MEFFKNFVLVSVRALTQTQGCCYSDNRIQGDRDIITAPHVSHSSPAELFQHGMQDQQNRGNTIGLEDKIQEQNPLDVSDIPPDCF